jgi:nitrite reductase (NADH) large subunit
MTYFRPSFEGQLMKKWRCRICGYIHAGENPPELCPVCGATAEDFKPLEDLFTQKDSSAIKRIIIVGNGAAGIEAARTIRENNTKVEILVFSDERYPFYSRIHLSTFIAEDSPIEHITIHPPDWYEELKITTALNTPIKTIDPKQQKVVDQQGHSYSYDKLILATGAAPAIPSLAGIDKKGVSVLRNLAQALQIRERRTDYSEVVIIGGGILGIEAAASLRKSGKKATIIEISDHLMPQQLDKEGALVLTHLLEARGITVKTSMKVKEISGASRVQGVRLVSGEELPAQMVIFATGINPNIVLAVQAGIKVNRGIVVNQKMETDQPNIFAAGDAAEFHHTIYGIWPAAVEQGIAAGANALGISFRYRGTTPLHILKVAGIEMTTIGKKYPDQPGEEQIIFRKPEAGEYVKLVHNREFLLGGLVLGITGVSLRLEKLIKKNIPIRNIIDELAAGNWEVLRQKH